MKHLKKVFISGLTMLALIVTGCDSQSEIEETQEALDASVSNSSIPCLGNYPAIFDNFNYPNTSANIGVQGAIFGQNDWRTCAGTYNSRFWYRYNHDDLPLGSNAKILYQGGGSQWAKLILRSDAGFTPANERIPMIRSGAQMEDGTYVARVKFSDFEPGTNQMQAFWLYTARQLYNHPPQNSDWREYDFEWNNWFVTSGQKQLSVVNHANGTSTSRHLDCVYYSGGNHTGLHHCHDGNDSYLDGSKTPGRYENEWLTLLMVVDSGSNKVQYSLQADGYGGESGSLWGGDDDAASAWGKPQTIWGKVPGDKALNALFSLNWNNGGDYFSDSRSDATGSSTWRHEMYVEYFYYSPVKYLTHSQVKNEIQYFINNNYSRVNTTGIDLHK